MPGPSSTSPRKRSPWWLPPADTCVRQGDLSQRPHHQRRLLRVSERCAHSRRSGPRRAGRAPAQVGRSRARVRRGGADVRSGRAVARGRGGCEAHRLRPHVRAGKADLAWVGARPAVRLPDTSRRHRRPPTHAVGDRCRRDRPLASRSGADQVPRLRSQPPRGRGRERRHRAGHLPDTFDLLGRSATAPPIHPTARPPRSTRRGHPTGPASRSPRSPLRGRTRPAPTGTPTSSRSTPTAVTGSSSRSTRDGTSGRTGA